MEKIFHWLLTFNATSWIIVIYGIKEETNAVIEILLLKNIINNIHILIIK